MHNGMNNFEKTYSSNEIGNILGFKSVTVRKYALAFEATGYYIQRNDNGRRVYLDRDVSILREMKSLVKNAGVSVEKGACLAVSIFRSNAVAVSDMLVGARDDDALIAKLALLDHIPKIIGEIRELRRENDEFRRLVLEKDNVIKNLFCEMKSAKKKRKKILWLF